eukprot:TRINITY_DN19383_c0_g1_i1.p1 TRINITY_DN19383_c0_g1~~TRINITY_DN19383_c0_g1_i1.p1  ORF type:complete len:679 (-),score=110.63 TRINITY_DN19383_c0_g1_i1:51-1820(-)
MSGLQSNAEALEADSCRLDAVGFAECSLDKATASTTDGDTPFSGDAIEDASFSEENPEAPVEDEEEEISASARASAALAACPPAPCEGLVRPPEAPPGPGNWLRRRAPPMLASTEDLQALTDRQGCGGSSGSSPRHPIQRHSIQDSRQLDAAGTSPNDELSKVDVDDYSQFTSDGLPTPESIVLTRGFTDSFAELQGLDVPIFAPTPMAGSAGCLSLQGSTRDASASSVTGSRLQRRRPPCMEYGSTPPATSRGEMEEEEHVPDAHQRHRNSLCLATPTSRSSFYEAMMTPGTPDPVRNDLKLITGDVAAVMFDFDGTLTASPGDFAQRRLKQVELRERAPLLKPRLRMLREAGIVLGIISKSSEMTINNALHEAGLTEMFDGPLLSKAVGLEGKAGFIDELVRKERLGRAHELAKVLLVDDDVRELDRARVRGIQTYSAPGHGGLQEEDFDEIFEGLGLPTCTPARTRSPIRRPARCPSNCSSCSRPEASTPAASPPLSAAPSPRPPLSGMPSPRPPMGGFPAMSPSASIQPSPLRQRPSQTGIPPLAPGTASTPRSSFTAQAALGAASCVPVPPTPASRRRPSMPLM